MDPDIYSLADYNQLRSLPYSRDNRRSIFNQNSIVPESERLERFILWTTGVLSPGAMRQWGRHAVAFVGRRNFDDPFFMDRMFKRRVGRPQTRIWCGQAEPLPFLVFSFVE